MTNPTPQGAPVEPHPRRRRCTAISANGRPCRAWAVRTSDPPRCAPHGGGATTVGAPLANDNARTHGFYADLFSPHPASVSDVAPTADQCTIGDVIANLYAKYQRLSDYIDEGTDRFTPEELISLYRLHAQTSSRLGRLMRDREMMGGGNIDWLSNIMEEVLKELEGSGTYFT